MHIDLVGLRGSGKSTIYSYMKNTYGAKGRHDRSEYSIPSWEEFRDNYTSFSERFIEECKRFRDFRTQDPLPRHTLQNYKKEFCLYAGISGTDGLFVWDKGMLEPLMHTVLHADEDITTMITRIEEWFRDYYPEPDVCWHVQSKDSFERAAARTRNYQWDEATYKRMALRHKALMDLVNSTWWTVVPIKNDGSLEDLYEEVDNYVDSHRGEWGF